MKKKNKIIMMTMLGLIGTTTAVGAAGYMDKVSGILRSDMTVKVNGESTSMKPVFINGQAYLPARSEAAALGYQITYNAKDKEIEINKPGQEETVNYLRTSGVIVSVKELGSGQYQLEVLGKGENKWIILNADKDTVIKDGSGNTAALQDLKAGTQIEAEYGPIIAMSYPGQSHAAAITVGAERLIKEDVIQSVKHTEDGWQVQFGETKDGAVVPTLVLNAGKETSVLTAEGQPVDWADLKEGTKVRAYYGPMATKSIPPQSPLFYLVVLSGEGTEQLAPAAAQEFRDLSWNQLTAEQKAHVTTKQNDASVEVVDAVGSGVLAATDEQKKLLSSIQAAGGKLVNVTYSTDQDELLGPLTVVFDLDTKAFVGFNARR
ncbi:stalk domain-containing protein [Paenibacillus solisilvae]|uniref:Stalk domain-containing protein n=1 Tax=Paenibacillus solisilvae TaxID=2486751 RepID=A0ABW0VSJ7_9BACL